MLPLSGKQKPIPTQGLLPLQACRLRVFYKIYTAAMKKIINMLSCVLAAALFTGCVWEDLDDCYRVSLKMSYTGDGETDMFFEKISKVDLYIFDENGKFQDVLSYDGTDAQTLIFPEFKLDPGTYEIVAIANDYDKTEIKIGDNLENSYFGSPHYTASGESIGHDDNYWSYLRIEMGSQALLAYTLEFESSHIDVSLEISCLSPDAVVNSHSKASGGYEIYFENGKARTDFTNNVMDEVPCVIRPELGYDAEKNMIVSNDLKFVREGNDTELVLKVVSPEGDEMASMAVSDYLSRHPEIDITRQEALLPIMVKFTGFDVDIVLPEWFINDVTPEF